MTTYTIFGLVLTNLFTAIAQVESDRGATSRNVYQLRDIYITDVNRIYHLNVSMDTKYDERKSRDLMVLYWKYYGEMYQRETGKKVTYEVLARIHNGGPRGWRKSATLPYWIRVKKQLDKLEVK